MKSLKEEKIIQGPAALGKMRIQKTLSYGQNSDFKAGIFPYFGIERLS